MLQIFHTFLYLVLLGRWQEGRRAHHWMSLALDGEFRGRSEAAPDCDSSGDVWFDSSRPCSCKSEIWFHSPSLTLFSLNNWVWTQRWKHFKRVMMRFWCSVNSSLFLVLKRTNVHSVNQPFVHEITLKLHTEFLWRLQNQINDKLGTQKLKHFNRFMIRFWGS